MYDSYLQTCMQSFTVYFNDTCLQLHSATISITLRSMKWFQSINKVDIIDFSLATIQFTNFYIKEVFLFVLALLDKSCIVVYFMLSFKKFNPNSFIAGPQKSKETHQKRMRQFWSEFHWAQKYSRLRYPLQKFSSLFKAG